MEKPKSKTKKYVWKGILFVKLKNNLQCEDGSEIIPIRDVGDSVCSAYREEI